MGAPTCLPFERTERDGHDTAEPRGGHAGGGFYERQPDMVKRNDPQSGSLVKSNPSELRLIDLENMLPMIDHLALTRDGIHFNTQQGSRWINDVFQTQIGEIDQELRTTNSLARSSSTGGGRVKGNVPESLANRLGPLAMETGAAAPVAPSSDVREMLGNAPPPRRQATATPALEQTHRRAPRRRKELSQAAWCFGTGQTPAVGGNIKRACQRK